MEQQQFGEAQKQGGEEQPQKIRLKKEQEEKEHTQKEKAEAHLYTIIKVARDEDLKEQIGKDIYFDLVDHEKVRSFRIQKQLLFSTFKEEVAKEYGIPAQVQRFWLWAKRQNHTYRPYRPLTPHEETQSVGQLRKVSNKAHNAELKLFLEVELGLDLRPVPPEKSKGDILLFFKLYNPEKEELCFVGRLFVKALGKPSEILTKLNEMAGFTPNEEIELYEEIKFEPNVICEHIDKKLTFRSSQLQDGDIVCFQKSPGPDSDTQVRYQDVPSFLEYVHNWQIRLKKEQEEKEHTQKEKAEAHLYTIIKVARDEDLKEQIGKDIYFDLVDHEKVRSFRIQKQLLFSTFKEEVAKEYGIPAQVQRFWLWAKRQNHTYRPYRPLTPHEETQSVGQLRKVSNKVHNAELKLFLEVELGLDLRPVPPEKSKGDILLFFKLYNPEKEELCFVGRLFVKALGKPSEILTKLNEMAGFTPNEEIELYEEIKFEPNVICEHIDKKLTFRSSQLQDGDIVCFQKSPGPDSDTQVRYQDVPSFLEYVHNWQMEKGKTPKASWDAWATKIFCEICRDEVLAGNRPTVALNATGYKNLQEKFNAKTNRNYNQTKLKNRWDALKREYGLWIELKKNATGLGWNVQNGTIVADNKWWTEKIAANKEYAKFRYTPMENLDDLEVMFQNIHVSGSSSIIPGGRESTTPINVDDDIIDIGDDDISHDKKTKVGKCKGGSIAPSPNKKKSPMIKEVKRLDVIATINSVTSDRNEKLDNEIIEHLRMAVRCGAKEGSDEHYIATKLFIKQEYRAVFRSFETDEGRVAWLKRMYEDRKK